VTFVDISRRLQNDEHFRESEARFPVLVENDPDPLIMVNAPNSMGKDPPGITGGLRLSG
jgi:PAS domain-containing protein